MALKKGKGGYGSEEYDPNTGRYIKEGQGQYHAGVRASVDQLLNDLKSGAYDDPDNADYEIQPSELFANDNDEELEEDEELWNKKSSLVRALQSMWDEYNTAEMIKNTNFPKIDKQEFNEYGAQCESLTTVRDRGGFYNGYRGDPTSFEFNKALRFGFDKFYKIYPQFLNSYNLSPQAILERAKKLDAITSAWTFPEDKQVYRYVDTAPLISWFRDSGIFDDMKITTNQYNLEMLADGYDKQELVKRLQMLVGTKVPPDGSFSSFSCIDKRANTHMGRNLESNKRDIRINYNVRQGTPAFISDYENESEGLFNRHVGFFIQDARIENLDGKEIIVLEYGIQ